MRHALPALLLLAACGGSSPPPQQPEPDAPDDGVVAGDPTAATGGGSEMAQRVCAAIDTMNKQGCEFLAGYDTTIEACVEDIAASEGDPLTMAIAGCFETGATCASAETCVNEAMMTDMLANADGEDGAGPGSCSRSPAFGVDVASFSAVKTTMEQPIEVCGVQGELTWLTTVKCNDGSNPYKSREAAHEARAGSMGAGGRCGDIIDMYEVACPEGTYQVYMDMYACN